MTTRPEQDHYTGQVESGGPWQDRIDGPIMVRKLSVGPMDNNAYIVSCSTTRKAVLVDAPDEPERLRAAMADVDVVAVVLTHGHADHLGAWDAMRDDAGLEVWGHRADDPLHPRPLDRHLADGEHVAVGKISVEVIHIAAHTEGSLLYLAAGDRRSHLFSGDTLFPGGHGRTTTPEDHSRIMDGLEAKIFDRLADATWVYPGHGHDTTVGTERPYLGEWRSRGW